MLWADIWRHFESYTSVILWVWLGNTIPSLKSQENQHVNQMSTNHIWLTGACYMIEGHWVFIHFTLWNRRKNKIFYLKIISNLPKHYKIKIIQNKKRTKNLPHTFFLYSPTVDILLYLIYHLLSHFSWFNFFLDHLR